MKPITFTIAFIILLSHLAGIQVSGAQSGTWTIENNPYQIIGDVTIPAGSTLNINPGVTVQAMGVFQIIAQGNIIANGTEQDSIRFVSGMADQTTLWDGIRLENTAVQSQFSYCRVELGTYGIDSSNSPASITYCHFNKNQKGIRAGGIGAANPAVVLIDHNLIEFSQHNGILVTQNSNTNISYNEITNNGLTAQYYGAIQLSNQSAGGSCSPEIHHNHIFGNHKQGIVAWDVANANAINPAVHHNLIENNLSGIYFRQCSGAIYQNTVINNFIPGDMNSGAGIMISGALAVPCIAENIVTGNYTGFYLTENANPIIGNPALNLPWAYGMNEISNNIDANNVMHSIVLYQYTNAALQIYAQNNYWDYDTAEEIAGTITDHNDNVALASVIYDPWQSHVMPIYLAGTVTLAGAENAPCQLQLVSASSGLVLNEWTAQIGVPFQFSVEHDSLVYIVARYSSIIEEMYYGAYGGTENPTATQIVADVTFYVGDIALGAPPDWFYQRVEEPASVNGHMSYPLIRGWFVYAPSLIMWLYRDADYLRIIRIKEYIEMDNYGWSLFDPPVPPIWRKVTNLTNPDSWEQSYVCDAILGIAGVGPTHVTDNITTTKHGEPSAYAMIDVRNDFLYLDTIQIIDYLESSWLSYGIGSYASYSIETEIPSLVEPDGTLFPLSANNLWRYTWQPASANPTYFGYKTADSLSFYWIPPASNTPEYTHYRIYDNGTLLSQIPFSQHTFTIDIPQDGILHSYSLAAWNGETEAVCENTLPLTFTANDDNILAQSTLSIYPNPFSPTKQTSLNMHFNSAKADISEISIYNLKGQKVRSFKATKANTELTWNGKDTHGKTCAAGLYQIRLTNSAGENFSKKVMLIH